MMYKIFEYPDVMVYDLSTSIRYHDLQGGLEGGFVVFRSTGYNNMTCVTVEINYQKKLILRFFYKIKIYKE